MELGFGALAADHWHTGPVRHTLGDMTMPVQVVMTGQIACSFGAAPVPLTVIPMGQPVMAGKMLAANIQQHIPMANIATFGMCMAPTNPMVIAATAAALGVFTPMPCIPVTAAPWIPGNPTVMINGQPALNNACTCMCAWAGVITVVSPGQMTVMD